MGQNKSVSIIIPAYNSERFIAEAIESALNQSWTNKEIIVVDDGSNDATFDLAISYKSKGVKVIQQKNKGACAARNLGIKNATGDFIQLLDSDDILLPEKIERQIIQQKSNKQLTFCNTLNFFGEDKNELSPTGRYPNNIDLKDLITNYYIFTPTVLLPKEIFEKYGAYNEKLLRAQEHEFHVRVAASGYNFVNLNFEGVLIRHHKSKGRISNKSVKNTFDNDIYLLKLIESHIENFLLSSHKREVELYNELVNLAIFKAQQHGNIGSFKGIKEISNYIKSLIDRKKFFVNYNYKANILYNRLLKVLGLKTFEYLRYLLLTKPKSVLRF